MMRHSFKELRTGEAQLSCWNRESGEWSVVVVVGWLVVSLCGVTLKVTIACILEHGQL